MDIAAPESGHSSPVSLRQAAPPVIKVVSVVTRFGSTEVHNGISFSVPPGQLLALIGSSGAGKSVLLREMIGLLKPAAGQVRLFGVDVWGASSVERNALRRRFGVLFQDGALFSSLCAAENIAVPLREHTDLSEALITPLVQSKLALVGLPQQTGTRMPSELSGGMRKRVALARALVLEPELLFLDEPTSGLDPISARAFDTLIRILGNSLGLTIFVVTHDLDTLLTISDRVLVLDSGKILADGPVAQVAAINHPWLRTYFAARKSRAQS